MNFNIEVGMLNFNIEVGMLKLAVKGWSDMRLE
jgi:hypothetical protein